MAGDGLFQLFGPLAPHIEAALRESIQRFGVLVPVYVDQHGAVLDGHQRRRIAEDLGVDYATVTYSCFDDDERRELARTLNADRRHLSEEQRREVAVALRQQGHSYRAIGGALGVDHVTVMHDVAKSTGEDSPVGPSRIVGLDGRSRPAEREAPQLPHVAQATGDNEWYTPPEIIACVRSAMQGIDLDPASSAAANEVVGARQFFDAKQDGLAQTWRGRVFMNPPYSSALIGKFCSKLVAHVRDGDIDAAIVLVNNATETEWFWELISVASAVCFPRGRVRFWSPGRESSAPLQGQAIVFIGPSPDLFVRAFEGLGWAALPG